MHFIGGDLHALLFTTSPPPPSNWLYFISLLIWLSAEFEDKKRPQFSVTVDCVRFYADSDYRFSLLKSIPSSSTRCLMDVCGTKNLDN